METIKYLERKTIPVIARYIISFLCPRDFVVPRGEIKHAGSEPWEFAQHGFYEMATSPPRMKRHQFHAVLDEAVEHGHIEIARYCLTNRDGMTWILFRAIFAGNADIATMAIRYAHDQLGGGTATHRTYIEHALDHIASYTVHITPARIAIARLILREHRAYYPAFTPCTPLTPTLREAFEAA